MEMKELMKDKDNFTEAERLLGRVKAKYEIEDLTCYPVSSIDIAERLDNYDIAVEADPVIRDRKAEIGSAQMSLHWAKDLRTVKGWQELNKKLPNAKVQLMIGITGLHPMVTGFGIEANTADAGFDQVSKIVKGLKGKKYVDIRYYMNGVELVLDKVYMYTTTSVVLSLKVVE